MEIQHFSHEHPLTLCQKKDNDGVLCMGCKKFLAGPAYCCSNCRFYLHESCAQLPRQMQHFFHPCPLTLFANRYFICNACVKISDQCFAFRCENCDFNMDVECALVPTIKPEICEQIQHFSHWHPLKLLEKIEDGKDSCEVCGKILSGSVYGCQQCDFFLHELCLDIPRQIQHYFHSCPLFLLTPSYPYICAACHNYCWGLTYACGKCSFEMELKCALLFNAKSDSHHQQIQHTSHGHPLILAEMEDHEACCEACGKLCSGPKYQCGICRYYLHKSCGELPQQLQDYFHSCPLILELKSSFRCRACNEDRSGFKFHCQGCNFSLDIECALVPTMGSNEIEHFGHGHPLTPCELKYNVKICCKACGKKCSGAAYACSRCNFFLHKSCAELPREIQHPFHPRHPLTLTVWQHDRTLRCGACRNKINFLTYCCIRCKFYLHTDCSLLMPSIRYDGHQHLLTLFSTNIYCRCNNCFRWSIMESFLRCVICNFTIHIHCIPSLLQTIKHKCHIDPLTLIDFPPHEVEDDPYDDFYCDSCEEKRDRTNPVYYCAKCKFTAHVKCIIYEMIPSLCTKQRSLLENSKEDQSQEAEREISAANFAVAELEKEIAALNAKMEPLTKKREQLKVKLEVVTADIKAVTEEIEPLEAKIEKFEVERSLYILLRNIKQERIE